MGLRGHCNPRHAQDVCLVKIARCCGSLTNIESVECASRANLVSHDLTTLVLLNPDWRSRVGPQL